MSSAMISQKIKFFRIHLKGVNSFNYNYGLVDHWLTWEDNKMSSILDMLSSSKCRRM